MKREARCHRPALEAGCLAHYMLSFRLLPTPPFGGAVSFRYGQTVLRPTRTSTPQLVRTLRRTRTEQILAL